MDNAIAILSLLAVLGLVQLATLLIVRRVDRQTSMRPPPAPASRPSPPRIRSEDLRERIARKQAQLAAMTEEEIEGAELDNDDTPRERVKR